jgi:hypothetical protein
MHFLRKNSDASPLKCRIVDSLDADGSCDFECFGHDHGIMKGDHELTTNYNQWFLGTIEGTNFVPITVKVAFAS